MDGYSLIVGILIGVFIRMSYENNEKLKKEIRLEKQRWNLESYVFETILNRNNIIYEERVNEALKNDPHYSKLKPIEKFDREIFIKAKILQDILEENEIDYLDEVKQKFNSSDNYKLRSVSGFTHI